MPRNLELNQSQHLGSPSRCPASVQKFAGTTQRTSKPQYVSIEIRNTFLNTWLVFQLSHICKMSSEDAAFLCVSSHLQLRLIFQDCQLPMNSVFLPCFFTETAPTPAEPPATTSRTLSGEVLVEVALPVYWSTASSRERAELTLKDSYFPKVVDFRWSTRKVTRITENTFCFFFPSNTLISGNEWSKKKQISCQQHQHPSQPPDPTI